MSIRNGSRDLLPAMDYASNLATVSTSFQIVVTCGNLRTLTRQFLQSSGATPD